MLVAERFLGCLQMIGSKSKASAVILSTRSVREDPVFGSSGLPRRCAPRNDAALVLLTLLIALPCHADPNTYLIKHQTGKNSKSILDKKFVHLNAPSQATINPNSSNDTKGLETLSPSIQKAMPVMKSKPLVIKPSKTKIFPPKDNSSWSDYAVDGSSEEDYEELNVNAKLIQ